MTTLKTITMYLRAAKAELEDAGEDTEGMAISTSKLRESILALTSNRVDIMLDDTTFKSTYQIIKEISQAWSSMADVDQAALLELLGGKRNANATASLIANFDVAEQALKSATDSAGSAAAENEKYLDSILGKVAQFNAAFETLSATVIDADFSKGVVDTGTTILDTITKLIDGLGTLNTLAMGAGAALSLGKVNSIFSPLQTDITLNSNGTTKMGGNFGLGFSSQIGRDLAGIQEYKNQLDIYNAAIDRYGKKTDGAKQAQNAFNEAVSKAKTGVSGAVAELMKNADEADALNVQLDITTQDLVELRLKSIAATVATAALNAAISLGLSIAIQALVTGLDYLINREERIAEAAENAKSAITDINNELGELKSATDNANATLAAFGDQVRYVNGRLTSDTLSSEQITQYSEAVKTLTSQYPSLISGYDAEGNAIIDLSGGYTKLTERIKEAYKAKLLLANAELDENMPAIVENAVSGTSSLSVQLSDLQKIVDSANGMVRNISIRDIKPTESDLADWLYGENSAELTVGLSQLDATYVTNKLIAKESGKWFEDNQYFGVEILTDSINKWATGIDQVFSAKTGGRKIDSNAISEYLTYIIGDSDSETSAYIQLLEKESAQLESQIKAKWSETNQNLLSYFSTDESFTQINDTFGGLLSNIINGADWNQLIDGDVTWDKIKDYVQTNLVGVFNNIELDSAQADIKSLLSGGTGLTIDAFNKVIDDVKGTLLKATDGNEEQVKTIMAALNSAMAVTADDVATIKDKVYKSADDSTSALDMLKERAEQWIAVEKEYIEVNGEASESVADETEMFNEFYKSIENGNPTIAGLQALIEMTSNGSLEAAGSFADWKKQYYDCVKSFSSTKPYNDIVESFGTLKEVTDDAYKSFAALNGGVTKEEYQSWEPDEYRNKSVEIFKRFEELYNEGRVGTREFAQYQKYFGLEDMEAVGQFMQDQADYYIEGKEGLEAWLSKIYDMNQSGELAPDLASVEFLANGKAKFNFDIKRIDELAAAFKMTEEQAWNFVRATRAYSESWESMSAEDLFEDFDSVGLFNDTGDGFTVLYDDIAKYTGLSREEINVLIDKLNELDQFGGRLKLDLGLTGELEDAGNSIEKIDQALRGHNISSYFDIDEGIFTVTQSMIDDMLQQLSPENVKAYISQWSQISGVVIPAGLKIDGENIEDVISEAVGEDASAEIRLTIPGATGEQLAAIRQQLLDLGLSETDIKITDNGATVVGNIQKINDAIASLLQHANINISFTGIMRKATGTNNATPGLSLLGDERSPTGAPRPELVVSKGEAYLAGVDGPTIGYLNRGDQVYTYSQTKKILKGNKSLKRIPAFASGTGNFSYRGIGAGSLWSSVASSSNSFAAGSDFESLYKYHQHLLKMEQESQKDYLDWLNKAYKDAYARGEIELDDYYKYQEEVFSLIREIVQDNLNDAEHYIDMLGHYDGNEKQIIAIYKDLMSAIEKEIASARAAGLDDNDEYIQNLQKQWWSYHDEIIDIQDEISDNVKDSLEDLIDLRIKMIKQDLKDEKEALKDKKDYLKDFYDDQKEMLQDAYDEEQYLEEQAEKRKAVTDLQMQLNQLEYDDSAWAQKKKLQLLQDLRDAQKELNDFEKDHALEKAQELIDDTYDAQEEEIDKEIELIEEKEDHAKNLRDQAISDLQTADRKMYEDMIAWNAQYGSGIDQDITEKWENATQSMSNYYKLHKEYYEGIDISKGVYPEFIKKNDGSWSTNPVSGDNPANQKPQQPSTSTGKAGSVSGIGPQLQYGSRGNDVSALQTALKEMGLYSDKIDGHFGPNTKAAVIAFQRNNGISTDGIVGPNTKAKFKAAGYASGTRNATAGLHEVWEDGSEYIFTSSNGKRYRMFSSGEKVLNADATNFLYDFANSGGKVLEAIVSNLMNSSKLSAINSSAYSPVINMGDIIIQGGATEKTVSQMRRAQREQVNTLLKEFGRLRQ